MAAAFNGHVDVVRLLMEARADVHAEDKVCCHLILTHSQQLLHVHVYYASISCSTGNID